MNEINKDLDFLVGHELEESHRNSNQVDDDQEKMDYLVWHKLNTVGYQPAAREGHTAVNNELSVLVFGGFEAGKRVNNLMALEVTSCSWSVICTKGETPCPRSYHAASCYRNIMLVHGGETKVDHHQVSHSLYGRDDQEVECSQSLAEEFSETIRVVPSLCSQSTSVLNAPPALQDTSKSTGYRHDGVTLGDTLCGTKLPGQIKISRAGSSLNTRLNIAQQPGATSNGNICCLDDMYALDTVSMHWYKIDIILSPLPRKGHTLNILPMQDSEYAVIFGGYSMENLTLSNSIHICEAELIYKHYTAKRDLHYRSKQHQQSCAHVGVIKSLKQDSVKPVIWRTLQTTGAPPSPRYRHSSSLIHSADGTPLLVIMGGIGSDATVALNDVHILNLTSLHWTEPITGCDVLSRGCGGDGPVNGLYGHVAFSINTQSNQGPNASEFDTVIEHELLIFGGSANPNSGQSDYNQSMYAFNLQSCTWRCVRTGNVYPSTRANHAAAVVTGWAPAHTLPNTSAVGPASNVTAAAEPSSSACSSSVCAVVFGGLDANQCTSDTWALDLRWKRAGVPQQHTSSTQQREADVLRNNYVHSSSIGRENLQAPGLLNREQNRSSQNLIDSISSRNIQPCAHFNDTNILKTTYSLEKFRKIPFPCCTDLIMDIDNDRSRKQSVNSRKYINLAALTSMVHVSGKGKRSSSSKAAGRSKTVSEVRRRDSHERKDVLPIDVELMPMMEGKPEQSTVQVTAVGAADSNIANASLDSEDCNYYKNRTQTEQALLDSRKHQQQTEERIAIQNQQEVSILKNEIIKKDSEYQREKEELKKELQDSIRREEYLLRLNKEMTALMPLYGVKKM